MFALTEALECADSSISRKIIFQASGPNPIREEKAKM
jgi:hypothetical protein